MEVGRTVREVGGKETVTVCVQDKTKELNERENVCTESKLSFPQDEACMRAGKEGRGRVYCLNNRKIASIGSNNTLFGDGKEI